MSRDGSPDRVDGATLCLQCGLCCDGTVFRHTELKPDEVPEAQALGLALITIGGAEAAPYDALPQKCALFLEGCCSSYGRWRPAACGHYACRLLEGYVGGTRSLAECLEAVRVVRETLAATRQAGADETERVRAAAMLEVLRRKFFKTRQDPGPMTPTP